MNCLLQVHMLASCLDTVEETRTDQPTAIQRRVQWPTCAKETPLVYPPCPHPLREVPAFH